MQFSPSDRNAVSVHLVMSANRLNDGNPGLPPLTVATPGWEAGKGAGAVGSRDETRGVPAGPSRKMGSRDKRKYGIDSLIFTKSIARYTSSARD